MSPSNFIHKYFYIENELTETENQQAVVSNSDLTVYEVIRVVESKALFIEDHLSRMTKSLSITGILYRLDVDLLKSQVTDLCESNQVSIGNIELRIIKPKDDDALMVMGFVPHQYPLPVQYIEGVDLLCIQVERDNPQAKVKNLNARVKANELLAKTDVYEALLVNSHGFVTEGSRSNIFVIKDNKVYTAPDEMVLSGISRKHVIVVIEHLKLPIIMQAFKQEDIYLADAVLLCGTSPGVIPVRSIDKTTYPTHHPIAKQIMHGYCEQVSRYLKE
jgi:branched-chain amino acid aminotransferase